MAKKSTKPAKRPPVNIEMKRELQDFQVRQLKRNFSDIYDSQEYGKLCQFFANDIYAPKDFEERNRSFEQISNYFRNSLGDKLFHGLIRLLDLYEMSDQMDDLMVVTLEGMGVQGTISQEQYDEAYYLSDNYDRRVEQLDLIVECFDFTHALTRYRSIGWILKTARLTSHLFSSSKDNIVDMLQRGYDAMRDTPSVEGFNDIIYEREMKRLNRIYEHYSTAAASGK